MSSPDPPSSRSLPRPPSNQSSPIPLQPVVSRLAQEAVITGIALQPVVAIIAGYLVVQIVAVAGKIGGTGQRQVLDMSAKSSRSKLTELRIVSWPSFFSRSPRHGCCPRRNVVAVAANHRVATGAAVEIIVATAAIEVSLPAPEPAVSVVAFDRDMQLIALAHGDVGENLRLRTM